MTTAHPSDESCVDWIRTRRDGIEVLMRSWKWDDWAQALAFVNRIGARAEEQKHHPLVELTWGRVTVWVWTHDTGTITDRDWMLCRAIDAVADERQYRSGRRSPV